MSVVQLTASQEKLIRSASEKCGITHYNINAEAGSTKGDNYLGIIYKITVTGNGGNKVLHLILKSAHTSEHFRKEILLNKVFEREAYMYETAIASLQKFQEKYDLSQPFTGVAKFYGSNLEDNNEALLMENLKEYGYSLWDRMKPMDDTHVKAVFKEYAKFHAASMAFKAKEPKEFERVTRVIEKNVFEMNEAFNTEEKMEGFLKSYLTVGAAAAEGNEKATAILEKMRKNIKQTMEDAKNRNKENFVILHGDCWCNNILFKYGDKTKKIPSNVCFIDWQISKLGSPVLDLSYFYCACASPDDYQNLKSNLKTYHDTLSRYLRECDCDPDEIYSFDRFMDEWKRLVKHGIFLAFVIIKVMLTDSEDAPDITQKREDGGGIMDTFMSFQSSQEDEYNKRICKLLEFMDEEGYI
ncbi:uncharacterized protein LOC126736306 [Anthonomus grandis grandis]|uniref:uncharacterized protein LOC126736306 n=1 Tax=Anthonomus grandis grandis TaxID=2921223 RepID=UPI0021668927|nr:uncharacterized protein LOC126736306 [Anthonomus grandis grandis]